MNTGALIVGSNLAAIQAALDLADSGIPVTLVERSPFLGNPEPFAGQENPLPSIPQMLQAVKHPNITIMTGARVAVCRPAGSPRDTSKQVEIQRSARYVDVDRCTDCGDCEAVCPMPLPRSGGTGPPPLVSHELPEHCAVYKPYPQAVPNVYAIEKAGTAPCRSACPIDQRAQGYIALIREGRFADAYLTIKEENPFPSICGRVCNHRCEESCNRGKVDAPVNIMGLKRFVADWAAEHPDEIATARSRFRIEPKGKRVAIVGAGPAGLTAALDLVRMGYQATVLEAQPVAGGMMRLGVPDYRLPPDVVQREIDEIVATGVDLRLNCRVEDMGRLLEEGFDAVFIAVGAHIGVELPILGADLPDVHLATDYLRAANLGQPLDVAGKRVLVIGGGNVGLDTAQTAIRTGAAWVGMSCLESREKMPAFEQEIQDAEEEGVKILPGRSFREVTGAGYVEGEWVTGVRCVQVDFRGFVDGRPDLDEIPGTEEIVPADVVVFAVGQWPDLTGVPDALERFRGRWLVADEKTQVTNIPGVTAGGDVVTGTRFIVDAIAAGHKAAHALDTFLRTGVPAGWQATNPSQEVVEFSPQEARAKLQAPDARYAADVPRRELPRLPAAERKKSFVEIYGGFTDKEAIAEARRCLVCGACSECLACVRACQAGAIDHLQEPERVKLDAGAVIWADEPPPTMAALFASSESERTEGDIFRLPSNDPVRASAVVAQAMANLAHSRLKTPSGLPPSAAVSATGRTGPTGAARIGVFVCRCGDKIGEVLDVDALVTAAVSGPGVIHSEAIPFSCQPEGAAAVRQAVASHHLNRVVLAACSCCSLDQVCDSCTYQRVRCKSNLLGTPFEFMNLLSINQASTRDIPAAELVNIREQCAWAHRDNPLMATVKAKRLIAAAVAKAGLLQRDRRPQVEIEGRVLVAGEGEASMVCANALRMQNLAVAHCEELPTAITGSLGRFTVTLRSDDWRWQAEASAVVLAPAKESQVAHLVPQSGLFFCPPTGDASVTGGAVAAKVGAILGSGRILPDHNIASVTRSRCLGCGTCESVCEHSAVRLVEVSSPEERDPMRELMEMTGAAVREESAKLVAQVNPAVCQGCGTCAAHCPSSAISAGYSTDQQIEAMLVAILAN